MNEVDLKTIDLTSYVGLQSTDLKVIELMKVCEIGKPIRIKRSDLNFTVDSKKYPIGFVFENIEDANIKSKQNYPEGCIVLGTIFLRENAETFFQLPEKISMNSSRNEVYTKISKKPIRLNDFDNHAAWAYENYELIVSFSKDNYFVSEITIMLPFDL